MNWEEIKLAYYAGLFDGEGCIHIERARTKQGKTTYWLRCKVSLSNYLVLERAKVLFGGSLNKDARHKHSNRYDKIWSWGLSCKQASNFLVAIYPFLRIKKSQADLALQFQGNKRKGAFQNQWGNRPKMEAEIAVEEAQYLLMRNLKKGELCQVI